MRLDTQKKEAWMCECGVKLQVKSRKGICNACGKKYFKDDFGLKNISDD